MQQSLDDKGQNFRKPDYSIIEFDSTGFLCESLLGSV